MLLVEDTGKCKNDRGYLCTHVELFYGYMVDNMLWFGVLVERSFKLRFCLAVKSGVKLGPVEPECHFLE